MRNKSGKPLKLGEIAELRRLLLLGKIEEKKKNPFGRWTWWFRGKKKKE